MSNLNASSESAATAAGKGKGAGQEKPGGKRRTQDERPTPPQRVAVEDEPEVRWTSKTTQAVACTLLCGLVALTATQRAEPNLIPTPRFDSCAPTQDGERKDW